MTAATGRPFRLSRRASFWLTAAVLVGLLFASGVPSPLYPLYQRRWHFSTAWLSVVFAVFAIVVVVALSLLGALSDTLGRRRVIAGSLLFAMIVMGVFAAAGGLAWLIVARGLQGLLVGTATGALGAALLEHQPVDRPTRGTLVNGIAPTLGIGAGALGGGLMAQYGPAPTVLPYLVLAIAFGAALVGVLATPETVPAEQRREGWRIKRASVPAGRRRAFALLAFGVIATWAVGGFYLALGPSLVLNLTHSQNHLVGGLIVTTLTGAGTVAPPLLDRWDARRCVALGGLVMLAGLAQVTTGVAAGSATVFFVGTAVLGFGWGATFMGAFRATVVLADPARRAELIAAVYVVAYLSMSLPVIGAGMAVGRLGLHRTAIVFTAVIGTLVALALLGLRSARLGESPPAVAVNDRPCPCGLPVEAAQPGPARMTDQLKDVHDA